MNMNTAVLTAETLLDRLRDPSAELSLGERLAAGIQVTVLGVVIVALALVLLYFAINVMERLLSQKSSKIPAQEKKADTTVEDKAAAVSSEAPSETTDPKESEELVAVITAAIAASMETSVHNIVVRNIVRTADTTPAWGKAGRGEQINQMYRV